MGRAMATSHSETGEAALAWAVAAGTVHYYVTTHNILKGPDPKVLHA